MTAFTAPRMAVAAQSPAFGRAGIRNACVRALWHELVTFPKPGLVSLEDSGSHRDMDAGHFWRSIISLRHYFTEVAGAGEIGAGFSQLREAGIQAERRMLAATGGVNTHRGAIFNLGLLAAAAAYKETHPGSHQRLGSIVQGVWGSALRVHRGNPHSHGAAVSAAYGAGGAIAEAIAGFPSVYKVALPAYTEALRNTGNAATARVQVFFCLLAHVADTNLLHRAGPAGLGFAQQAASAFLDDGGVFARGWFSRALEIHKAFVLKNLSPGGSADLLAACVLVSALERSVQ